MFSSIRSSRLGYLVYSLVVIALGIGSLVFFWFMVTGFNVGVYSENTLVGSVYVGGLTEEEALEKVNNRVNSWLANSTVQFDTGYQGYYYEFDRDLLVFDVQRSISQMRDGSANPLVVSYRGDNRNFVKEQIEDAEFLRNLDSALDIDRVIDDMLADAAAMKTFSRKELHNYFIDYESQLTVLSESNYLIPESVSSQTAFHDKLIEVYPEGEIEFEPYQIYSVLDALGETLSSNELNVIGGALLEAITPTHMIILERHYNPQIDLSRYPDVEEFPYYGINARVNQYVDYDFSFENNSNLTYTIKFYAPQNYRMKFELIGLPYLNQITLLSDDPNQPYNEIEINYDTEFTNVEAHAQDGQNGRIITVTREIRDIYDDILSNQEIVFEFYPPVKEIKYQP